MFNLTKKDRRLEAVERSFRIKLKNSKSVDSLKKLLETLGQWKINKVEKLSYKWESRFDNLFLEIEERLSRAELEETLGISR